MKTVKRLTFAALLLGFGTTFAMAKDCVVLLHGLSRTEGSMSKLEEALEEQGYHVVNQDYPSRSDTIEHLSETAIPQAISQCENQETIRFVTHSMGGILVRDYYARHTDAPRPHQVVMLAPPNKGSEIIDDPLYQEIGQWWMGPSGQQLSAKPDSYVNQLPPVDYPTGVIAGDESINPYFTSIIPGADDGAVAVAKTQVEGQSDWIVIHANHSFIMTFETTISQVLAFFANGEFLK